MRSIGLGESSQLTTFQRLDPGKDVNCEIVESIIKWGLRVIIRNHPDAQGLAERVHIPDLNHYIDLRSDNAENYERSLRFVRRVNWRKIMMTCIPYHVKSGQTGHFVLILALIYPRKEYVILDSLNFGEPQDIHPFMQRYNDVILNHYRPDLQHDTFQFFGYKLTVKQGARACGINTAMNALMCTFLNNPFDRENEICFADFRENIRSMMIRHMQL